MIVFELPAFLCGDAISTCMCLRLREQCLRSKIPSVARVALRVDRKNRDCSNAPRNPQQVDLCVLASSSCCDYAEMQGRNLRPAAGFRLGPGWPHSRHMGETILVTFVMLLVVDRFRFPSFRRLDCIHPCCSFRGIRLRRSCL